MSYKDLNVYKRAYKVAIDLHLFLKKDKSKIPADQAGDLKSLSREILANIAEATSQRTPRAKRYFNFKALDAVRRMILDLDFMHDTQNVPSKDYEHFNKEYEVCAAQLYKLNQSILNKELEKEEEAEPVKA